MRLPARATFADASRGLPADPEAWDVADVGQFLRRLGAAEPLVQKFAHECLRAAWHVFRPPRSRAGIDGEALLLVNENHLEAHFAETAVLGLRLKILKGVNGARRAAEEIHHPGLVARLGHGLDVISGMAGPLSPRDKPWAAGGNATDWQVEGFKKARDSVGALVVVYEVLLVVGAMYVGWIPPGAHLVVLLPVLVGLLFELFVWSKT